MWKGSGQPFYVYICGAWACECQSNTMKHVWRVWNRAEECRQNTLMHVVCLDKGEKGNYLIRMAENVPMHRCIRAAS
jgi:hypothetical protein